jgi:hypothetical protein
MRLSVEEVSPMVALRDSTPLDRSCSRAVALIPRSVAVFFSRFCARRGEDVTVAAEP